MRFKNKLGVGYYATVLTDVTKETVESIQRKIDSIKILRKEEEIKRLKRELDSLKGL